MRWFRDNSLTLALAALFAVSVAGQAWAGWHSHAQEQLRHGASAPALASYLVSGAFLSALFENWESEFLQMAVFVVLTAHLFQRGSPESRDPDKTIAQDRDPVLDAGDPEAPWPVRAGGVWRALYARSLGSALFILFAISFALHWLNSVRHAADEARNHGEAPPQLLSWLGEAQFWFESFQNWQSEFLSTAVLVVLAIFLRERGSPESKPVGAPHSQTSPN